jgi:hypothetical protein
MAYRYHSENPPKPEDMLIRFAVRNGATLRSRFRCYYLKKKEVHDPHWHDHINWPAPNYHPGPICQMKLPREYDPRRPFHWLRRYEDLDEIHLTEEGYTQAFVTFEDEDNAQFLEANAWIDGEEDNAVHMVVYAGFPSFSDKPVDVRFTLFVQNGYITDAVGHGIITVLPGRALRIAGTGASGYSVLGIPLGDEDETGGDEE